jgi:hypothetical protein
MNNRDELWEFHDFVVFNQWNAIVFPTELICGLEVYLVEALNLVYLVLVQKLQLFQNGEFRDEIWWKWFYESNALWILYG